MPCRNAHYSVPGKELILCFRVAESRWSTASRFLFIKQKRETPLAVLFSSRNLVTEVRQERWNLSDKFFLETPPAANKASDRETTMAAWHESCRWTRSLLNVESRNWKRKMESFEEYGNYWATTFFNLIIQKWSSFHAFRASRIIRVS